jgi:hypothetical protein
MHIAFDRTNLTRREAQIIQAMLVMQQANLRALWVLARVPEDQRVEHHRATLEAVVIGLNRCMRDVKFALVEEEK